MIHHDQAGVQLLHGDILDPATLAEVGDGAVQTIVTSPPYFGLRDYGVEGQLGAEETVGEYVDRMVAVFAACRRVLADDGVLWLNLGDSYASASTSGAQGRSGMRNGRRHTADKVTAKAGEVPAKNLIGVPWRVALALQDDGWILRSEVIWSKPNAMPESVRDRPTRAHEHLFLFAKSPSYFYDSDAIAEPISLATVEDRARRKVTSNKGGGGARPDLARDRSEYVRDDGLRNARTVWTINTTAFSGAHFAVWPEELARRCVRAGSAVGDLVLDPFSGSGTTGMVARREGRRYVGVDLNREYLDLSLRTRFAQPVMDIWSGDAA